jgi:hypothetical protein
MVQPPDAVAAVQARDTWVSPAVAVFKTGATTFGKYKNPERREKVVLELLPMAKSPIVVSRPNNDDADDARAPNKECWPSSILKLLDDMLAPNPNSARAGDEVNKKAVRNIRTSHRRPFIYPV